MTQLQSSGNFSIVKQEIGDRERRSNLTIIGTQPSDTGAYRCVAVNEFGATSENATLTVHGELSTPPWCVHVQHLLRTHSSVLAIFAVIFFMFSI